ncbi:SMP-30/gluconolactonase/LRE family protein [Natrialbaceae archaeon A-CW2]|uniref:SMP-30/gluconolactonase/LRE family protein n=1 Tax=Natronosalvus amylolyticus TaxID=2961994 RepID=UPI0020C9C5CB|nr:SMP-30/gluconolactonase/LRE family protein [Natronosalvus amylolyticus]
MTRAKLAAEYDHRVGEGPIWHPDESLLYWVDIPSGRLYTYDPTTDQSRQVLSLERAVGGFTIQADGSLALFLESGGVALWDGSGGESDLEYLIDAIPGEEDSRFNDVIADPEGRVFAGTMPTESESGHLYRVDTDGTYVLADEEGYDIPNGMGFTPDGESMYVTESEARTIHRFEYDRATGDISGKETFVEIAEGDGVPDGLTVDEEGFVWSARWNGHSVVRHAPDGTKVDRIDVPVPKASSVTFGGDDSQQLYVTTAKGHDGADPSPAGSLFRAAVDVAGVPEFRSRLALE